MFDYNFTINRLRIENEDQIKQVSEEFQKKIEELQSVIADLKRKAVQYKEEVREAEIRCQKEELKSGELQAELDMRLKAQEEEIAARLKVEDKVNELFGSERSLKAYNARLNAQLIDSGNAYEALQQKCQKHLQTIAVTKAILSDTELKLENAQGQLVIKQTCIEGLEAKTKSLSDRIEKQLDQIQKLNQALEVKSSELVKISLQHNELSGEYKRNDYELPKLLETIEMLHANLAKQDETILNLNSQCKRLQVKRISSKSKNAKLNSQIGDLQQELKENEQALAGLQQKYDELCITNATLSAENQQMDILRQQYQSESRSSLKTIQQLNNGRHTTESELQNAQDTIKEQKLSIKTLKYTIEDLKQQNLVLTRDCESLRNQLTAEETKREAEQLQFQHIASGYIQKIKRLNALYESEQKAKANIQKEVEIGQEALSQVKKELSDLQYQLLSQSSELQSKQSKIEELHTELQTQEVRMEQVKQAYVKLKAWADEEIRKMRTNALIMEKALSSK